MENFDLRKFESKLNEKIGKMLNRQVSIKRVGAFGTAVVLATSVGFGKLILDKKNMTLKHATEVTELYGQLDDKNQEISFLESKLESLKSQKNDLEIKLQEKLFELNTVSTEFESINQEISKIRQEPFLAIDHDQKRQFSLTGMSKKNKIHLPEQIYNINVGENDIDYYDYFELNIPTSVELSFNGLAFEKKYDFDEDYPNGFCFLAKDLAVIDKKNNRIYFNETFQKIYIDIYNYYRNNYNDQKALELMEKVWESVNYVSVKTVKEYCNINNIKPNIIELNNIDSAYSLNYLTDSLTSKIMENDDVLISMHEVDPDYYVGERNKISSYKISLSRDEQNSSNNLESGVSRGL